MNYYDELLENINKLIKDGSIDEAKSLIINELNMPYIPSDIEDRLKEYLIQIKASTNALKSLTEEDIIPYLTDKPEKQLIGVDALGKKNLRDYIDICDSYLKENGYVNAKALLIDSLIRQEINYEFTYVNNGSFIRFNPKDLIVIEETHGFKHALEQLQRNYYKDPSKNHMAMQLLYKEALLSLPNQIDGDLASEKIINYIDEAFSAK